MTDTPLRPAPLRPRATSPWPDGVFSDTADDGSLELQSRGGRRYRIDRRRWHEAPGAADLSVLRRVTGPVLDIGCGPGRLVVALVRAGEVALGIDSSAAAVATARRRGAPAVHTSVFGLVPAPGQWGSALLLDGNIGIGGDARALLRRVTQLLAPGGRILVEVEAPTARSEDIEVRVDHAGRTGRWFAWSTLAAGDVPRLAHSAGLGVDDVWQQSGRWFAQLVTGPGLEEEAAS